MGNILSYIQEKGHLEFDELGFSEVDSLIFSELAYLDYSCCSVQPTPFSVTLGQLKARGFCSDTPEADSHPSKCSALFNAAAESRRFRDVGVDFYVNEIDPDEEKQFSAVTFRLSLRLHYLAFRGTDGTIAGWKENLNLSFTEDLPAQRSACAYFEMLNNRMRSHWILGGHSKGGNLAVYAALSAQPKFQRNIALIYDHDGPGFLESVLERPGYAAIAKRIYKTVPESAVVGLLLSDPAEKAIVKSSARAILQHSPLSWVVEDGHLVTAEDTDALSKATDRTVRRWIRDMSAEDRRIFADALYALIQSTGAATIPELAADWKHNLPAIYMRIRQLPPEVRKALLETINGLARASGESMLLAIGERARLTGETLAEKGKLLLEKSETLIEKGEAILQSGEQLKNEIRDYLNRHSEKP